MIDTIRRGQREPERRRFLRQASAALLLLAIGGTAPACKVELQPLKLFTTSEASTGIRPGRPMFRRSSADYTTPKGAQLDWPVLESQIQVYVSDVSGAISRIDVARAVAAKGPEICACYLIASPHPNPRGGAATITLSMARDGTVEDVHVYVEEYRTNQSTFGDFASIAGLMATFKTLRFETSGEKDWVQFTINLGLDPEPRPEKRK